MNSKAKVAVGNRYFKAVLGKKIAVPSGRWVVKKSGEVLYTCQGRKTPSYEYDSLKDVLKDVKLGRLKECTPAPRRKKAPAVVQAKARYLIPMYSAAGGYILIRRDAKDKFVKVFEDGSEREAHWLDSEMERYIAAKVWVEFSAKDNDSARRSRVYAKKYNEGFAAGLRRAQELLNNWVGNGFTEVLESEITSHSTR